MSLTVHERIQRIERGKKDISLSRQAELLGVSRSAIYYEPRIDPEDILLTQEIDKIYTAFPFMDHGG